MNLNESGRIIEAILFGAGYPVTFERIAEILETDIETVKTIITYEKDKYEDRGIQLIIFEDSCQLCTKEEYESYVKRALGMKSGGALSNSALEVLAVVAYNQPVTRAFVEQVRGVDCSYAISSLCEKQLIECSGRLDVPGRPMLYSTTDTFLRCFGLASISELPKAELLETEISKQDN